MKIEYRLLATWRVITLAVGLLIFTATFSRVLANVTLQSFTAKAESTRIRILWLTASEVNHAGFFVERSDTQSGPFTRLNSSLIPPSCPGCPAGGSYAYSDNAVTPGKTYYYRLVSVDISNKTQTTTPVSAMIPAANAATATPTNTTAATATRTNTAASNATATKTNTPAPTPTRTNTLVPGAPTFTPAPTLTPSPIPSPAKIAIVAPSSTRVGSTPSAPSVVSPVPATAPTLIAIAPVAPPDEPAEEELLEDDSASIDQGHARLSALIGIGIVIAAGVTGFVGLIFATLAIYLFARAKRDL